MKVSLSLPSTSGLLGSSAGSASACFFRHCLASSSISHASWRLDGSSSSSASTADLSSVCLAVLGPASLEPMDSFSPPSPSASASSSSPPSSGFSSPSPSFPSAEAPSSPPASSSSSALFSLDSSERQVRIYDKLQCHGLSKRATIHVVPNRTLTS